MKNNISKRKTPLFCILRGLSNKQKLFFMSYIHEKRKDKHCLLVNGFLTKAHVLKKKQ